MAYRTLAGYPAPNDSGKYDLLVDLLGPASYNNTGTFGTSGQQINASDFGFGGMEDIGSDMMSNDGVNVVEIVGGATIAGTTAAGFAQPGYPNPPFKTAVLHWYTNPTRGTEVANTTPLNTKFVRLRMVMV